MTVTKETWKETIRSRKAALKKFERDNAQAIQQAHDLLDQRARLAVAANEKAPPGYVRCGGIEEDDEDCEEMIPRNEVVVAGWRKQLHSCGDETDDYVCPRHSDQRDETRCRWCDN